MSVWLGGPLQVSKACGTEQGTPLGAGGQCACEQGCSLPIALPIEPVAVKLCGHFES